jgi:hypothetical protein
MPQNDDDDTYTVDTDLVADIVDQLKRIIDGKPAVEGFLALNLLVMGVGAQIDPDLQAFLEKWLLAVEHDQEGPQ